ncbi:MAG: DUF305 domain-containing protein [Anaerolineales bacterium]
MTRSTSATRWLWPALTVVFALATLSMGLLWWLAWSQRLPAEGDPAVTFARDMAAHHRQAVQMAVLIRDRTNDDELRQFLIDVILTQQAQIGYFEGWLTTWGLPLTGPEPPMTGIMTHEGASMRMTPELMGMASLADVNALGDLPLPEAEVKFLQLMIKHHRGGVMMAEALLAESVRPEVRRLAESIVTAQTSEIDYMTELLQQRGATP